MRVEVLTDPSMALRGEKMLKAMMDSAPIPVCPRNVYVGDCEILMAYGTGHPIRRPWILQHLKNGGRFVGWDLGYWKHQDEGTFRMRLTIDADHPQKMIRPEPPERWDADQIALRNDYNPNGPILIIGMSKKANRASGVGRHKWEASAAAKAREAYPGRKILFKVKRDHDDPLPGYPRVKGPIEDALRGASLVVCKHSNVAVDACIAGVPVVCEDGAASVLYGADIRNPVKPTTEQRLEFLRSLAWWQWKPEEAKDAWKYILSRLS